MIFATCATGLHEMPIGRNWSVYHLLKNQISLEGNKVEDTTFSEMQVDLRGKQIV